MKEAISVISISLQGEFIFRCSALAKQIINIMNPYSINLFG